MFLLRKMGEIRKITISTGKISIHGELTDTQTADAIWNALPINADCNRWGGELYFEIPIRADLDKQAKDTVDRGDLGFWPTGNAFCIFFGPTPISTEEEIRPASAVNIVGRIVGDTNVLNKVSPGERIRIEKYRP
ncbi:MAG: cyclophilin-like fold protein [Thermodesulfobacteriota bacterium]|nr:cyclophilin-like fold protein [Thermodesulfobacteriota bacterium]